MTAGEPNSANGSIRSQHIRWLHLVILMAIVAFGGVLRFRGLTKLGLWPDEFWSSVHMATGRGNAILELPAGVLFDPPPSTELQNAPRWWHIWTGLSTILHPPFYHLLLRGWMEIFSTSDVSTRSFSAIASLASIVVLFAVVRETAGTAAGLFAAALMATAPIQINLSQESQPYTLLTLVGLLTCESLLRIERLGPSPLRLFALAFLAAATALTHYFSLGALIAIAAYAVICLRGDTRKRTVTALCVAAVFVLVAWGPFFLKQHGEFATGQNWAHDPNSGINSISRAAAAPSVYLYGGDVNKSVWIAPAVIAYFLPLLLIRRYPRIALSWLWVVGIIGSLMMSDLIHHSRLLEIVKYISLAAPGLYAICAIPLPTARWWRWAIPVSMLISVLIALMQRIQTGPPDINGDWRGLALALDRRAGRNDPIVFYPNRYWGSPGMYYLDFAHYAPGSQRPIMYLNSPASQTALAALKPYKSVWLVGPADGTIASAMLPGWSAVSSQWFLQSGGFTEMTPAPKPIPSTSRPPAHRGSPPH